ncbi:MAG TPA: hypothetical protein VM265_06535 [Sphingomicrobium sp.]|nr:hypothetical protein [Sphingomicrobium sp.]
MNEQDVDARLRALLAERPPAPDPAFSDRVIGLAAFEQAERRARRRAVRRLASETLALVAVLATFALLARAGPVAADLGDTIPLASPAMLGLAMLVLWALVGFRPAAAGR